MSWYLFKESPAIKYRGKKVNGFQDMHRPKINISWGLNQKSNIKTEFDLFPSTIMNRQQTNNYQYKNMKVLTESSENQEELMTLVKNQKDKKNERQILDLYNKSKRKSQSIYDNEMKNNQNNHIKNRQNNEELSKKIKYLQQNLLPTNKKDSINAVFNHELNKNIPLSQSQVSYRSSFHNKKNESTLQLGHGFNAFNPPFQKKKQLTDELIERYAYEQKYKERVERHNIILG